MPYCCTAQTSLPVEACLRGGGLCSGDNYRGIALGSACCKIIDLIIIDKYKDLLCTSDLQFAFKSKHSTEYVYVYPPRRHVEETQMLI